MLCLALVGAALPLQAQPPFQPQPPSDPIGDAFFPPDMVMQHQQAIGLTEDQRTFIIAEIHKAQTRFTELQWQLQHETETMAALVNQGRVDEQRVLAQLDKVLSLEREIKRTQLTLMIRIRNTLTAEQRARLQEIKTQLRGR